MSQDSALTSPQHEVEQETEVVEDVPQGNETQGEDDGIPRVDVREFLDEIEFQTDDLESFFSAKTLFKSFVKRQLFKSALKKSQSLKDMATAVVSNQKERLKRRGKKIKDTLKTDKIAKLLLHKQQQFEEKMKYPPFLRTVDKFTFVTGIMVMCITELFLLQKPEWMHAWYTALIIPLLLLRFFSYHKQKYHYFMLDFCYFSQCMLLIFLFFYPRSEMLFKIVFALCSGPLPIGAVMWKNSMVFHDLDKMTSVFIHIFPPIVVYCLRWYPQSEFADLGNSSMSLLDAFGYPVYAYLFWQVAYYVKTEIMDRQKLNSDKDIITSSRWMAERKPHPIYTYLVSKGINVSPVFILMGVQFFFTLGTYVPIMFLYNNWWVHTAYLLLIFLKLLWNGASYYFEVFSESYSKRMKTMTIQQEVALQGMSPKKQSFVSTCKFLLVVFGIVFVQLNFMA